MIRDGDKMIKVMKRLITFVSIVLTAAIILVVLGLGTFSLMEKHGYIMYTQEINPKQWEVFGVDVSSYQGTVNWETMKAQGVDFAFIKASEGSSLQDSSFGENWENAIAAGIRTAGYHFFSYDSSGATQADNFIEKVPVVPGAMPPVIDVEFYGEYLETPMSPESVFPILSELVTRLEEAYGQKPILYVTYKSYELYVKDHYSDYPIWVSSPTVAPFWIDWTFWQYSHSARMEGYVGTQERIDLNVFRGTLEEFKAFGAVT